MKLNLHNPTLTIIDGKGEISGYPEKEPNEEGYKFYSRIERKFLIKSQYSYDLNKWRELKLSYHVEEESIEELKLLIYGYGLIKRPTVVEMELSSGVDITSIVDRLEIIDVTDACDITINQGLGSYIRLIPQQIKEGESQEGLFLKVIQCITPSFGKSTDEIINDLKSKYLITPKK